MTHDDVHKCAVELFPQYLEKEEIWFANGKSSIRVRLIDGREFIFTCYDKQDYRFETVKSFMKEMRRKKGE